MAGALHPFPHMDKKPLFPIMVVLVLGLLAAGCKTLLNIENPDYAIRSINPRVAVAIPLSASTIDFDFLIDVKNPNRVGLTLDRIDFDLLVNDNNLLRGVTNQNVRIPANGIGTVDLKARVGYQEIRSIFTQVADVIQGNRAQYKLRGTVYYNTPLGQMSFPLTVYSSRM